MKLLRDFFAPANAIFLKKKDLEMLDIAWRITYIRSMVRTVHYVGMDFDTYLRARLVFGGPAYYHKYMDARVYTEVADDDLVVIGDPTFHKYVWDASAVPKQFTD